MSKKVKINQKKNPDPFNFAPKIKEVFKLIEKDLASIKEDIGYLGQALTNLDGAFCSYIDFNGNSEEWKKDIMKKPEEIQKLNKSKEKNIDDSGSKKSGDSSRGTGTVKIRKPASEKQNKTAA